MKNRETRVRAFARAAAAAFALVELRPPEKRKDKGDHAYRVTSWPHFQRAMEQVHAAQNELQAGDLDDE